MVEAPGYSVLSTVALFGGNPFGSPGQTLIRKSALTSIGGFDSEIWGADDHDMWIRLMSQGRLGEGGQLVRRSLRTFLPEVKEDPLLLLQIFAALIKAPWKMRKFE